MIDLEYDNVEEPSFLSAKEGGGTGGGPRRGDRKKGGERTVPERVPTDRQTGRMADKQASREVFMEPLICYFAVRDHAVSSMLAGKASLLMFFDSLYKIKKRQQQQPK